MQLRQVDDNECCICRPFRPCRPEELHGTRVAPAQHPLENPAFAELRHCAATPSSEQSTLSVPFCARLVRLFGEDEVQQNRSEAGIMNDRRSLLVAVSCPSAVLAGWLAVSFSAYAPALIGNNRR